MRQLITYPQKLGPAALALYWLGRMWRDLDHLPWGQAWIAICTVSLVIN